MKLEDIDPNATAWKNGRWRNVGKWAFCDWDDHGVKTRNVFHYGHLMGCFVDNGEGWTFDPYSTGWGSVSDQGGMNKIMRGYGWYYRRAGGAEYVQVS